MSEDGKIVEQVFHIEEMKRELEELSDGQVMMGTMGEELPPAMEEQFLEQVLDFENAPMVTHREQLTRDGVMLPAPDELNDDELALKLIEVIHTFAARRIFLDGTNHLSDRELYTQLCEDVMDEMTPDFPADSEMNCHIDLITNGDEEGLQYYLRYYADEEMRELWAKDFPDQVIPPHEDPPYDRDRHLPQPPPPPNPYDDPALGEAFCSDGRRKLERKLEADGLVHGPIVEEPLSYAGDLACVWAIERLNDQGSVEWWSISGDLPTTYLPAAEVPDARAFLHVVSRRWRDLAEAMENGNPPEELVIGAPKDWPRLIPMLNRRADILEDWAGYDEAWEE